MLSYCESYITCYHSELWTSSTFYHPPGIDEYPGLARHDKLDMAELGSSASKGVSETAHTPSPAVVKSLVFRQAAAASSGDTTLADPTEHIDSGILPRLDPAFVEYFLRVIVQKPPAQEVTIAEVREKPENFRSPLATDTSGEPLVADHEVTSEDGAKITVRVYHPDPDEFGHGPYPVHVNFHGMQLAT